MSSEIKDIVQYWGSSRLALFLKVRNIDIPKGLTRNELVELVISKKDVPIIQLKATREILQQLVHQQLVSYLERRGYVILNKGKISMVVPDSYKQFQESELLKGALKDFDENYSKDPQAIDLALEQALDENYNIEWAEKFILKKNCYQSGNLDSVLDKFGITEINIKTKSIDSKSKYVEDSLNFFNLGATH